MSVQSCWNGAIYFLEFFQVADRVVGAEFRAGEIVNCHDDRSLRRLRVRGLGCGA